MRYLLVILMVFVVQGCARTNHEKYDLKSPCVAAETDKEAPCQKRRPVNQGIS